MTPARDLLYTRRRVPAGAMDEHYANGRPVRAVEQDRSVVYANHLVGRDTPAPHSIVAGRPFFSALPRTPPKPPASEPAFAEPPNTLRPAHQKVGFEPFAPVSRSAPRVARDNSRKAQLWVDPVTAPASTESFRTPLLRIVERIGRVTAVGEEVFEALVAGWGLATDEDLATFRLISVPPEDRDIVSPGATFYWTVGYQEDTAGRWLGVSFITMRRLPSRWLKDQRRRAQIRAGRNVELLGLPKLEDVIGPPTSAELFDDS
jgi:hypothetical protein